MGVPIVYLSAGSDPLHDGSRAFLAQFPAGVLLDGESLGAGAGEPRPVDAAHRQEAYTTGVIEHLEHAFPPRKAVRAWG